MKPQAPSTLVALAATLALACGGASEGPPGSAAASAVSGVDLVCSYFQLLPGASSTLVATTTVVVNRGTVASPDFVVRYIASKDVVASAGDVVLGEQIVAGLGAGASVAVAGQLAVPVTLPAGFYYVAAIVDPDGLLGEAFTANNTLFSDRPTWLGPRPPEPPQPEPAPPEFVQVSVELAGPLHDRVLEVVDTVRNDGGPAYDFLVRFYLTRTTPAGVESIAVGERYESFVEPFEAGAQSTGVTQLLLPQGLTGSWTVVAVVDPDEGWPEVNEADNTATAPTLLRIPGRSTLDLQALAVAPITTTLTDGMTQVFTVADTVRLSLNPGVRPVVDVYVRYVLSEDEVLDAGDIQLFDRFIAALVPGEENSDGTSVEVTLGFTGTYHLFAVVDPDNAIFELDETNNAVMAAGTITVVPAPPPPPLDLPDLAVTGWVVPFGSGVVTITDSVTNLPNARPAPASAVRFLLSRDVLLGDDVVLGERTVPALGAGESSGATSTFAVPPGTVSGTYYVIAVVDPDGLVAEASERNNVLIVDTPIRLSVP